MTHAGNVFVLPCDLKFSTSDLLTLRNGFLGLGVEYFCVKFGGSSCIGFLETRGKNIGRVTGRQTDRQTDKQTRR